MHRDTVFRTLRRLVLVLLALAPLPATGQAQTKWYSITGIAGVQFQRYDENFNAAIWNVRFTVVNMQNTATWLAFRSFCGPFSAYSTYYDDVVCPPATLPGMWQIQEQQVAPGATAIVSVPIYVDGSSTSGTIALPAKSGRSPAWRGSSWLPR